MTVDGEPVVRVALRARSHVLPLGEQPNEHADVIERLEDGNRTTARGEQRDERITRGGCPLHDAEVADPGERVTIDRQPQLGRARREREHAHRVDLDTELERDPIVTNHDAVAERSARPTSARPDRAGAPGAATTDRT